MVPTTPGNGNRTPTHADTREGPTTTTREAGCAAPPSFQTLGDNYIRAALQGTGLSTTATSLICNAWREGTKKQYDCTVRRWREFCCTQEIHPITPHVNDVVEFLAFLYEKVGRYGVLATARSTLGNFLHIPGVPVLANHPLIQKVVKGAYNTKPPAPRYVVIWDTDFLLQYLDSLENNSIDLLLSYKVTVLLTILSGQRVSTLYKFHLPQLQLTTDMAVFNLGDSLLKHSKPGWSTAPIIFHRYPHGRRLCPLQAIQDYIQQRNLLAPQVEGFLSCIENPTILPPRIHWLGG